MIDKYKYTTLSYPKNGLSFRSFHKECFYREKNTSSHVFLQFLPSNEAENASRIPLGSLQNAHLARSTSSRTTCLRQTRLVMSPSTCGASRSQRKRICHTQSGKPLGIGTRSDREISKNSLQIRHAQFVLASLQPYILTTLHYYVFIFHFAVLAFSQSSKCKMAGAGGDALPAYSCYFFMLFYLFFITRGDTSRRAGPHPPLSPHDVAIPGYGASRRRSAYAACRWVCRSPRR